MVRETLSFNREKQVQDEIARLLRQLADPVKAGESVKACIRRASMRSGLNYSQAKKLWYSEIKNIPAHIADHLRERAAAHDKQIKRELYRAIVAMQDSDPAFFGECIEEMGGVLFADRNAVNKAGGSD